MRSKIVIPLFFLGVLIVLIAPIKTTFNYYDEGFTVFHAAQIMDGYVPYRDFWTLYPPGQLYTLAILFSIFGRTLLVARIYDTCIRFVIVISIYWIAKKITIRALAVLVCIIVTFMFASVKSYTYVIFPSLALGFLSILSLFEFINTRKRRWLHLTGILIGIVLVFRWDMGVDFGISAAFAIMLFHDAGNIHPIQKPIRALMAFSKLPIILVGTALLVAFPCYGYWGFRSGFNNMWTQLVIFPVTTLRNVRWLPYPPIIPVIPQVMLSVSAFRSVCLELLNWLHFYLPLLIFGIVFSYYIFAALQKRIILNKAYLGATVLAILGILLFVQGLNRFDFVHILPTSIAAFLAALPFVHKLFLSIRNRLFKYICFLLLTILTAVYISSPFGYLFAAIRYLSPFGCYSDIERAGCIFLDQDEEKAVEYITTHTGDAEFIFVGNRRHDLVFINDIGFYFLSARPSATKYAEFYPGVTTTNSVQEGIVHDIESHNVKWIILMNAPDPTDPNASAVSSGVNVLDDFIKLSYTPVAEFGHYAIWKKVGS
jgi:hypothetical protein